ncbi:YIP1 family protein [Streptomyces sp. NBC_01525]|uniref:YIP1 family protein n=1 Tax=Streptomyces benahoarensis TaxID=2595054 RepID=A0A553ZN64_9ACTN|nr:Yip1 family protein [Streptomyces benahoarensis]TSB31122.1 YIP1 family protein [Streptomyces benahoarensis]TSB42845.1 YIP1 family protein [Streptomyces benahoarensis]
MGSGQDPRAAQDRQQQGQQAPYGQGPYGQQPPPPHGQWQQPQPGQYGGGPGATQPDRPGEPEYFGDGGYQQGHAPYSTADAPGHTQQFSLGDAPDAYGQQPYGDDGQYDDGVYRAGQNTAPSGPRLHWKQLLPGIVLRPVPTFWQMRDHQVWAPALIVSFLYGLLAVFGFDKAREDVLNATLSQSIPWVLITAVMFIVGGLILGAVTHTLARQLGGDGAWAPTIGLSMLITALTDAPRLLFAMFLGGDSPLVTVLGWLTWLASGFLLTQMVSKSHDLPWPKALGASAIQLVALLALVKLGTL